MLLDNSRNASDFWVGTYFATFIRYRKFQAAMHFRLKKYHPRIDALTQMRLTFSICSTTLTSAEHSPQIKKQSGNVYPISRPRIRFYFRPGGRIEGLANTSAFLSSPRKTAGE